MTIYINLTTNEYPRHDGDIVLDLTGQYALVEWVDPPTFDGATQRCYEGSPVNENGTWRMTWIVEVLTQEEIDEKAKTDALLAKPRFLRGQDDPAR